MSLTKFVGLLAGSTLTLTSVSFGATEANNDTTAQQIKELQAEINSLKAQQGEQWLTEQRAAQVRGIVQDVLADADTRASLQNTAATSGYDNGFFIQSADGNFKLKLTALEQIRFVWNNRYNTATGPENQWGFENRRTQIWFTGNVVDPTWTYAIGLQYNSQLDSWTSGTGYGVNYLYVQKQFGDFFVRVGQFSVPWTLESQLWSAGQTQTGEFSPFEYMFGVGLGTGAMAGWSNDMLKIQGSFVNNLDGNVFYNPGVATPPTWNSFANNSVAFSLRGDLKLAGKWEQFADESSFRGEEFGAKIGVGFIYANTRAQNAFASLNSPLGVTVDGMLDFGGANIIAQFAYNEDVIGGGGDQYGFNVQGGFFIADALELFGAWTWAHVNFGVPGIADTDGSVAQFGGNWYIAKNNCKATLAFIIPIDNKFPMPAGMGLSTFGQENFSLMAQLQVQF